MLITGTGWTVRELNATPWPDVADLLDYWLDNPPLHVLAKRAFDVWFQVEEREEEEPAVMNEDELRNWMRGNGL